MKCQHHILLQYGWSSVSMVVSVEAGLKSPEQSSREGEEQQS